MMCLGGDVFNDVRCGGDSGNEGCDGDDGGRRCGDSGDDMKSKAMMNGKISGKKEEEEEEEEEEEKEEKEKEDEKEDEAGVGSSNDGDCRDGVVNGTVASIQQQIKQDSKQQQELKGKQQQKQQQQLLPKQQQQPQQPQLTPQHNHHKTPAEEKPSKRLKLSKHHKL